jgi:hypothetical protein
MLEIGQPGNGFAPPLLPPPDEPESGTKTFVPLEMLDIPPSLSSGCFVAPGQRAENGQKQTSPAPQGVPIASRQRIAS